MVFGTIFDTASNLVSSDKDQVLGEDEKVERLPSFDLTPDPFVNLRGPLANALKPFLNRGISSVPTAEGPLVAPLSEDAQALIDAAFARGSTPSPLLAAAQASLGQTLGGDFLPSADGANPFLQATIEAAQRPLIRAFEDTIVPQLLSRFTQRGQEVQDLGSSAFAREARLAGQGLQDSLSDVGSRLSFAAFEGERDRQTTAAGLAPAVTQAETDQLLQNLQATLLPQAIEDLGIQRGLEQFNAQVQTFLELMTLAGSLSSPTVATQGGVPIGGRESAGRLFTDFFGGSSFFG